MRKYQEIERTSKTQQLIDTLCDICGLRQQDWKYTNKKYLTAYDYEEITIEHEYGKRYPEGGSGEKLNLDICPVCFNEKIMPFIGSIATLPIEYEEVDH